jgi:hypothetical protein
VLIHCLNKKRITYFKTALLIAYGVSLSSCVLVRLKKFQNSLSRPSLATNAFPISFKFKLDQYLFLHGTLNNSSIAQEFMLDTGSPCTYCFKTKKTAGLESKKLVRYGGLVMDYGSSSAEIATIKYRNLAFLVSDMAYCWKEGNAGYIGANAMQNSIWEFNFQDTTITVSDSLSHFNNISGAYKVNFKPHGKQETPVIKIAINDGDSVSAFIDTGNDKFLQLNSKFDPKRIKNICSECIRTSYYNINQMGENVRKDSIVETNFIKTNSLKIGDLEFNSAILSHIPLYKGKNLVGLDFLKRFIVTMDWKHKSIYLKPFENPERATIKSTYGFKCEKIYGVLKITEIFRNSLVESNGIKCGDQIFKINSKPAEDLDKDLLQLINGDLPTDKEIIVELKTREIRLKKERLFN